MISDCGSITGQAIDPTWNRVMLERMMRKMAILSSESVRFETYKFAKPIQHVTDVWDAGRFIDDD